MKSNKLVYWACQIGGWLAYGASNLIFELTRNQLTISNTRLNRIGISISLGLLFTHFLRLVIVYFNFKPPFKKNKWWTLLLTVFGTALLYSTVNSGLVEVFKVYDPSRKVSFQTRAFYNVLSDTPIIFAWSSFYYLWHYIQINTNSEIDKVRLESLVKDLELKTIKSHINPHFIFNALNSIRALVDENPTRARTAITELSNILRSSMQTEKIETTSLEKELNIVKDYLALEHIRFEDRLKIEYEIDNETLNQSVPPMMLQTLVENAIKHGISQLKSGGIIKIISKFKENNHLLIIENTGILNNNYNSDGFGIASTINRLNLMYGKKATFGLIDLHNNTVQASVVLPI